MQRKENSVSDESFSIFISRVRLREKEGGITLHCLVREGGKLRTVLAFLRLRLVTINQIKLDT